MLMKQWGIILLMVPNFMGMQLHGQFYQNRLRVDSTGKSLVFHVTDETAKTRKRIFYYWFKSGHIHKTEGSYDGKLLHGKYQATDMKKRLVEEGSFHKGVKTGLWRTWHENGHLRTVMKPRLFSRGFYYKEYDSTGSILKFGYIHNNLFTGSSLELAGDTTRHVKYKNGVLIPDIHNK